MRNATGAEGNFTSGADLKAMSGDVMTLTLVLI